ncbi:hypothetical protein [uncultured Serinicoccus sp.]|uniref:hypothetical protein n=1 Tax=uncultured Serinicoccus sp. TaxID=735514 RepID=UPI0026184302|nr:hypothetical protein [uncultured Serinicoccus sp.]
MPLPPRRSVRLDPRPVGDLADAVRGRVHDPLWFVARQWQMGEFQGEDASTPVQVLLEGSSTLVRHVDTGREAGMHPAEALVEAEAGEGWTTGRRVRVGARVAAAGRVLPEVGGLRLRDLPPPYEALDGAWDGLALWRRRGELGIPDEEFGEVPEEVEPSWDDRALVYDRQDAFRTGEVSLHVSRHRGGSVDWWTVDAGAAPSLEPTPPEQWNHRQLPTRLEMPGMPRWGLWEIEDAGADIGAVPPDAAHTATSLMTALFFSQRDEWFDVPVPATAGTVVRIGRVVVTDSFGLRYSSDGSGEGEHVDGGWPGLRPPAGPEWTLFRVSGMDVADLLLWQVATRPLAGELLEHVQLGVDDASNVVWAVERRLRGRDVGSLDAAAAAVGSAGGDGGGDGGGAGDGTPGESLIPAPPGDTTQPQAYVYVPGEGAQPHWIPYTIEDEPGGVSFVQRRLADYSTSPPTRLDVAQADVLAGRPGEVHRIVPAAVPPTGMELVRRWQLARTAAGDPVLWVERRRRPLTAPPARRLRFDVAEPVAGSGE